MLLDSDLAALYGVEVKALNRAVKRNMERFPADFVFQLTAEEAGLLRCQFGTLEGAARTGRGKHRKYLPFAFTEQGVAMLSSVLRSPRAVRVNIEIMRAFVRLRRLLQQNADLARQLAALERKYDAQFKVVFDAIRRLAAPGDRAGRPSASAAKSREPGSIGRSSVLSFPRRRSTMRSALSLALTLLACFALVGACDDDEDNGLDSSHPGWGDPGCFGSGCHDQDTTHHSDLRPFECVECHGNNGAPSGHGGDTPCGDCHGSPHGNNGFPDPESCLTCH